MSTPGVPAPDPGVPRPPHRRSETPYVFAYDISCRKRHRKVLAALRRWRLDGQYSVHETLLRPAQAQELAAELLGLVDRERDAMLMGRLSQRGHAPVYQWHPLKHPPPLGGSGRPEPLPRHLHRGPYLLAYDVRCPRRLQRVQRAVRKESLFLQRSVYYYEGDGDALWSLIERTTCHMRRGDDDLRLYPLAAKRDLWFLCGTAPTPGVSNPPGRGLWQQLWVWLKTLG